MNKHRFFKSQNTQLINKNLYNLGGKVGLKMSPAVVYTVVNMKQIIPKRW